jgi:hypothetical protein
LCLLEHNSSSLLHYRKGLNQTRPLSPCTK